MCTHNTRIGALALGMTACLSMASVSDVNGFDDAPRTFNDRPNSALVFNSNFDPMSGTLAIAENNYGAGGFANRHIAFFADADGGPRTDFDYGDAFTFKTTLRIDQADSVDNLEAGFQVDLFGFGFFGVLSSTGEIAAFGGPLPFHSFGPGVYSVGDEVALRMTHTPGGGEGDDINPSTMTYEYNNLTTGSGWISSGAVPFGNLEFGLPSAANGWFGLGGQINNPDDTAGAVDFRFFATMVPAPATSGLLLAAAAPIRRRRRS